MAEIPKLIGDSVSLTEIQFGEMGIQKIAISDQDDNSLGTTDMSDSFIVDIENLSIGSVNKDISANSRISLQRNLSRKGSQRVERNKTTLASSGVTDGSSNACLTSGECDSDASILSPKVSLESKEKINKQPQQTITITAENRCNSGRRYFKQRTSSCIDPRRVLIFFATLSSMGTIILLYFTLSLSHGDNSTQAQ
ncbi:hypothetical protein FRX31_028099 [Thalictrum thalictroides]|uniref:Transmembrane protein n=1 Tax=Thalictrum thalictroides TaxID=46969 RepID=A0A7J6VB60_THATH|nr:hypothetical protein FRX31_028099 [Thalictrum thalictroides]